MADLLADIGGTNTRFRFIGAGAPAAETAFRNADFASFAQAADACLKQHGIRPRRFFLAIAGVVDPARTTFKLTNHPWTFDRERLKKRFGLTDCVIVNDFEATGYALAVLKPADCVKIRPGRPAATAYLVIGPGTGLGACYATARRNAWHVLATEAGHTTLSSHPVFRTARRLSAEDILSGRGLAFVYRTLTRKAKNPAEIHRLAAGGDKNARKAYDIFFAFLGDFAGNMAVVFKAFGGVYLSGAILNAPQVADWLKQSDFGARFADKGKLAPLMRRVPVFLIRTDTPALAGLRYLAARKKSA
ncbi:MAG: ROK family protein [Alphaproteobacteria bacterium]|nr:ROK family protein [Alphaproteobacteria bacterium]